MKPITISIKNLQLVVACMLILQISIETVSILSRVSNNQKQFVGQVDAFSVGRFGWPGLEWREIIDWWTSGYSRGVVIGRNYIPPCKLCDMPRMFRVD